MSHSLVIINGVPDCWIQHLLQEHVIGCEIIWQFPEYSEPHRDREVPTQSPGGLFGEPWHASVILQKPAADTAARNAPMEGAGC
jgi:hypothetical protein